MAARRRTAPSPRECRKAASGRRSEHLLSRRDANLPQSGERPALRGQQQRSDAPHALTALLLADKTGHERTLDLAHRPWRLGSRRSPRPGAPREVSGSRGLRMQTSLVSIFAAPFGVSLRRSCGRRSGGRSQRWPWCAVAGGPGQLGRGLLRCACQCGQHVAERRVDFDVGQWVAASLAPVDDRDRDLCLPSPANEPQPRHHR